MGAWLTATALVAAAAFHPSSAAAQSSAPLVDAVKRGDTKATASLLQTHVNVNQASLDGTTALHWAASNGDLLTVKRLLAAGAKPGAVNRYGVAPIWLAAQNGDGAVVEALLRAGADANTERSTSGETVLMIAARAGHAEVMQRLIAHGADVNAKEHVRGQSALIWAAGEGHAAAVKVLGDAGADLELRSSTEMTPLMFAIRSANVDAVRELLDQGADVRAAGKDGTTMLSLAIINANWEMASFLVSRGADVNGTDPVHGRPLHTLAFMRRAENRGLSGVLPRKSSGRISSLEFAQVLIKGGARVNDRIDWKNPNHAPPHMSLQFFFTISYLGATPFFLASRSADIEFMKFLLANGADPNIQTAQRVSPLLGAAGVGYSTGESPETVEEALEAVKLLASLGCDLNATADFTGKPLPAGAAGRQGAQGAQGGGGPRPTLDGSGALHGAVQREAPELVKWLLAQGVPVDQKTKNGLLPIDIAYQTGLGTTKLTRDVIVGILRDAMVAKGIAVPPPPGVSPKAGL